MAFGFKSAYERILDLYNSLNDEEKQKIKAEIEDINKAEDEREIDEIEEDKADDTAIADEKAEEVAEESEEIANDIEDAEATEEEAKENEPTDTDEATLPAEVEEPAEETQTEVSAELPAEEINTAPKIDYEAMTQALDGLNAKYSALEKKVSDIMETLATGNSNDVGISGFGTSGVENKEEDARMLYLQRMLGKRA